ncbi:MAG: PilZ domain-containing protein [Alphaproteobacteria bacterium]|nr:PilZ domain-containing protein [Alphaproteobacteria bacterium]
MGLISFRAAGSEAQVNRRAHVRRRVSFGSFLAMPDASQWIKCHTLDLSFAGARVHMDEAPSLPPSVYFLQMRDRLAYEARIAWHKSPEAGLEFLKVYRFADVPDPALRRLIEKVSG